MVAEVKFDHTGQVFWQNGGQIHQVMQYPQLLRIIPHSCTNTLQALFICSNKAYAQTYRDTTDQKMVPL